MAAVPRQVSWSIADVMGDPAQEALLAAAEQQNLAHQVGKVQQWLAGREAYDRRGCGRPSAPSRGSR